MSKTDLLIVIDHKWRDLPGMAALSVILERMGLETALVPYTQWRQSFVMPHV